MMFRLHSEDFGGVVKVIEPTGVFGDERGFFSVTHREDDFRELGLPTDWVQSNHSRSIKNVIRGLHFQPWPPMAKLMRVSRGGAYLVAVDLRRESSTFLKWTAVLATEENRRQQYAPAEFARGFCSLSDVTEVQYMCTGFYDARGDQGVAWNDPAIGIKWPIENPILSERDSNAPTVVAWLKSRLAVLN